MSRGQRLALVFGAVVVVVIAFVVLSPGEESSQSERPAQAKGETGPAAKTDTATEKSPAPERPAPAVERLSIEGGAVKGGPREITASRGETVRVVVSSDAPDELHLHGFDITRTAARGKPARFRFKASIEGSFEMESHTAEDAGRDPLVARVVVEPK